MGCGRPSPGRRGIPRHLWLLFVLAISVLLQSSLVPGVGSASSLRSGADRSAPLYGGALDVALRRDGPHRLSARRARTFGKVLFDGARTTGWFDQSANPTRVSPVLDPKGGSDKVLRFEALNQDVYPLTPTDNPRAQLITPYNILRYGHSFWETYEVYLPRSFPKAKTHGAWIALGSPFYGGPCNGPPSVSMMIEDGKFRWRTNAHSQVPGSILWQSPIVTGKWSRFTWHIDPTRHGHVELYVNDRPVLVSYNGHIGEGATLPVVDASNKGGPWFSQLSVYYGLNAFSAVTIYFRKFTIATTRAAAERRPLREVGVVR
jgi:hypothetical protein